MRHPLATSHLVLALAAGFALLSSACGGGSSNSSPAPAPVTVSMHPTAASLVTGGTQSFSASVAGTTNSAVTWSVVEAGGGTVDTHGLYTAPVSPGTFHVRATSVADTGRRAEAVVTVTAPPAPVAVSVSPASASLATGGTRTFTASVTGTANPAVTWSVVEAGGGSVDAFGVYTAPSAPGTFHVRATSAADTARFAEATVTVSTAPPPAPVAVTVSPTTATLAVGLTQTFTAVVTGTTNPAVTWSVTEPGGGTVDAQGLYTAPSTPGAFHVRATSAADTTRFAEAAVTVTAAPPTPTPSIYLLLSTARLDQIRADAAAGKAAWVTLKRNVDTFLDSTDETDSSTENFATAYLVTKDRRYADRAFFWAQRHMSKTLREDDYYFFGDRCRAVALTLNYCADALTADQAKTLSDFLAAAPDELWFHNQANGWGLDDPRNNYHQTFIMGTAFAGYALKAAGDARGDRWITHFKDKLEGSGGVLDYLDTGVPGGDWDEGLNYAMGSKMHLGLAMALSASAGDTNHFNDTPFFQNSARFLLAATQPGGQYLYPGGDLAWQSSMPLSPFYRAALQPAVFWQGDCEGRRLGQWILTHLVPTYTDGDRTINLIEAYYLDVLFAADLPETDPTTLPTGYHTPVTQWVNLRSGWDDGATSLSISGSPRILESHQHMDTGSFTLWKGDWQAADASTYSPSGEIQGAEAHNLLRVPGADWFNDESVRISGMQRYEDLGALAYAQVDITRLYRHIIDSSNIQDLLTEHTREFVYLRPDVLVVFDRVAATPAAAGLAWCLHFPQSPTFTNGRYVATHGGGGMSLVKLLGGTASIKSDGDLEAGTTSFRLEEAAAASSTRFLNVLEVAAGAPPATPAQLVSTPGAVQGAKVAGSVVLFSDRPRGAAPTLPFTYTIPGTDRLDHVLCNMAEGVDVHAVVSGGNTVVTLTSGTQAQPDAQGVVRFTVAP